MLGDSLESIRQRIALARLNTNPGVVNGIVDICRAKTSDTDVNNALGLIVSYMQIITTLTNDIEYLLSDIDYYVRLLDAYRVLEDT